ncbi:MULTISPECIES: peroxiredoxin-like family protein [Mycolicibacterium]|uniref:Alkyl hydroperoxide reductase n=1 Tax=Mycolicibacterium gadium TaxID=1794 RepID=A0A7I7WS89_MYCGU|nr:MULTISPECIES: peroxiredoxin-like family protein [Mycolicibacterium]UJL32289.1 AhpC/TSA family protein [Mycolicibacterium vanbaalenii]WND60198.1 peroxiredoxin-like family protein [Mycolicibacterium vanbaalenii]BBZ18738.1 alkyl hydroperoxide reductase [Mycolicibacterium gadium]
MPKIEAGDVVTARELADIHDKLVRVPDQDRLVHLQFRRFAGCPICNLHLRSISGRHDEIIAAGVREVVVFHSSAEAMREFQSELPFTTIADPGKHLYREFGVESSPMALLSPRAMLSAARGMKGHPMRGAAGRGEDHLGLPADFLIGPDGRVLATKYGRHADDQWSVDELLEHVSTATR